MNQYTLNVTYDKAIIRHALRRYLWRRIGFVVVTLPVIFLLSWIFFSMGYGRIAKAGVMISVIPFGILWICYLGRIRQSETFLSRCQEPTVSFGFSNAGVEIESDLGSSALKWEVFDEVMKFPSLWLLIYGGSAYLTIPADKLNSELKSFIESKIGARSVST